MRLKLVAAISALALPALLFAFANDVAAESAGKDFAGLVDIGGDRKMYLECRGTGSPTVVLISGKGNGAADWNEILDPADPIHKAPTDLLAAGQGKLVPSDNAVMPSVSRFTRVCAYDRPGTRLEGPNISTPVPQPHTADRAVEDLHALLAASGEAGPYVLVAHSYGGVIATLYARTYQADVAGLVMVDAATELMQKVASPKALAAWDAGNKASSPEAPEAVELLDAFAKIEATPPSRGFPAIVLSADKPWPDAGAAPADGDTVNFADWLASGALLAKSLDAPRITQTNSGHNIYQYTPQAVIDAIRKIVDEVRDQSETANADIDEDFSIVSGLSGGPTSYLDGIKKLHWVMKLLDRCGLGEQHIRGSATNAFARTKLGFVSNDDVSDFFERPLFQLVVTALPAGSGCAASVSARVIAPIEGARFVQDKKPLQKDSFVTIWESGYGEGGRPIYEPSAQIAPAIEATLDILIAEFAEAWTHSQGIGHPKYGAP